MRGSEMSDLFNMLNMIARRRKPVNTSPFATRKSVMKWLHARPNQSDYDTHHRLVEGLERFNAENAEATEDRLVVLMLLEEAGLLLQNRIIEQYVQNQTSFKLAKQTLWRESHTFWAQLSHAYLGLFKSIFRSESPHVLQNNVAHVAVRALRYLGLAMRWEYHQGQLPTSASWRRINKIYRLAERGGYVHAPLVMGDETTHCAREFALVHLMGLVQPLGYRAQEIEEIARLFREYDDLPLPGPKMNGDEHTHAIDLGTSASAFSLGGPWTPGKRVRYLAMRPMLDYLKNLDGDSGQPSAYKPGMANLGQQLSSMIERGGVRRDRPRTSRFGRVWVAGGMDNILSALTPGERTTGQPVLEPWMMRDESAQGIGFTLPSQQSLAHGQLIAVSWDPAESVWQVLAVRWNRDEEGRCQVGTERLTRHPKLVHLSDDTADAELSGEEIKVLFLPMSDSAQGVSNLLIPARTYREGKHVVLRDGELVYRLRLGGALETHESWVRVGMDVLTREYIEQAA